MKNKVFNIFNEDDLPERGVMHTNVSQYAVSSDEVAEIESAKGYAKESKEWAEKSEASAQKSESAADRSEAAAGTIGANVELTEQYRDEAKKHSEDACACAEQARLSALESGQSADLSKIASTNAEASSVSAGESAFKAIQAKDRSEQIYQIVVDANTSAENAARRAESSATGAKASETKAKESEAKSKTSETNAAKSAEVAKGSENIAQGYVDQAKAQADISTAQATIATNKANEASGYLADVKLAKDQAINAQKLSEQARDSSKASAAASQSSASSSLSSSQISSDKAAIATTKASEASSSAAKAKTSETNAKTSETNADVDAKQVAEDRLVVFNDKEAAKRYKESAAVSESNASKSASTSATKASEASSSAIAANKSALDSKSYANRSEEIYEAFAKGSVYRGGWNPQLTPSYPLHGDTNSYWDVYLNAGFSQFVWNGIIWYSGDRLIYSKPDSAYFHINRASGVISVNGKSGNVSLTAKELNAVSDTNETVTNPDSLFGTHRHSINHLSNSYSSLDGDRALLTMNVAQGGFQLAARTVGSEIHVRAAGSNDGVVTPWSRLYTTGYKPTWGDVGGNSFIVKDSDYIRVSGWLKSSSGGTGFLPFSANSQDGPKSNLGTSAWTFKESWVSSYRGGSVDVSGDVKGSTFTIAGQSTSGGVKHLSGKNALRGGGSGSATIVGNTSEGTYIDSKDGSIVVRDSSGELGKIYHQGNKPTSSDIGALPISGGKLTGRLNAKDTDSFGLKLGATSNAVGMVVEKTTGGRAGGLGMLSRDGGVTPILYLGWGESPWESSSSLNVTPTSILYKGNKIYHSGDKPTAADVGALSLSTGDARYVKKDGDTMSSALNWQGGYVSSLGKTDVVGLYGKSFSFVSGVTDSYLCANTYWDGAWKKYNDSKNGTTIAVFGSNPNPKVYISPAGTSGIGTSYSIYHEGNKPTAADVGALSQSTADSRYVNVTGDTVTGTLTVNQSGAHPLVLHRTAAGAANCNIQFGITAGKQVWAGAFSDFTGFGIGSSGDLSASANRWATFAPTFSDIKGKLQVNGFTNNGPSGFNINLRLVAPNHQAIVGEKAGIGFHETGNGTLFFMGGMTSGTGGSYMGQWNSSNLTVNGSVTVNGGPVLSVFNSSNKTMKIQTTSGYVALGPANTGHCHYETDRSNHWFNREVRVNGEIYCGSGYNQRVYHTGNKPTASDTGSLPVSGGTLTGQLRVPVLSSSVMQTSNLDTVGDSSGFSFNYSSSSAVGKPTGTDHAVLTQSYSGDWQTQLASDWRTNRWYVRSQENKTWKPWAELYSTLNKPTYADVGAIRNYSQSTSMDGTSGTWSTTQMIDWLTARGAFAGSGFVLKNGWSYANNKIVDTGIGKIHLAGAVVECFGNTGAKHVRITTAPSTSGGDRAKVEYTYYDHGKDYAPGWTRTYNTSNKPTPEEIGAMPAGIVNATITLGNATAPSGSTGTGKYYGFMHVLDPKSNFHSAAGSREVGIKTAGTYYIEFACPRKKSGTGGGTFQAHIYKRTGSTETTLITTTHETDNFSATCAVVRWVGALAAEDRIMFNGTGQTYASGGSAKIQYLYK